MPVTSAMAMVRCQQRPACRQPTALLKQAAAAGEHGKQWLTAVGIIAVQPADAADSDWAGGESLFSLQAPPFNITTNACQLPGPAQPVTSLDVLLRGGPGVSPLRQELPCPVHGSAGHRTGRPARHPLGVPCLWRQQLGVQPDSLMAARLMSCTVKAMALIPFSCMPAVRPPELPDITFLICGWQYSASQ